MHWQEPLYCGNSTLNDYAEGLTTEGVAKLLTTVKTRPKLRIEVADLETHVYRALYPSSALLSLLDLAN